MFPDYVIDVITEDYRNSTSAYNPWDCPLFRAIERTLSIKDHSVVFKTVTMNNIIYNMEGWSENYETLEDIGVWGNTVNERIAQAKAGEIIPTINVTLTKKYTHGTYAQ